MLRLLIMSTLLVTTASDAWAGFKPKAMRDPLEAQEVARGLILPKGWVQLEVGAQRKIADGAWTSTGERRDFESKRWIYDQEYVGLRMGLGPKAELWWQLPFTQATLQHHGGTDEVAWEIRDASIGDPRFGYRYELYDQVNSDTSRTTVVIEGDYKAPAGSESAGTYIGGPLNVSQFVFTTGTPDIGLGLVAKQRFGPAAITARVGYVRRFSGTVQYLVELENLQFAGRIKPGDIVRADLGLTLQGGPVALVVTPTYQVRGATRVGTTSKGISPGRNLDPIGKSGGDALDVEAELLFNASRNLDIALFANVPVLGEDLMFFPIEDLHPTLGTTLGSRVEVRY